MLKALRKLSDEKGFTLVELLVVIAIIGILATLLILQLGVARSRARDAKRIADVNQVRSALELFFDGNGQYPATNTKLKDALTPKYLQNLPQDPLNDGACGGYTGGVSCYGYAWKKTGARVTQYQVWAELEQWAQALSSDGDINASAWTGAGVNGSLDDRTKGCTDLPKDCVYDQGQSQ